MSLITLSAMIRALHADHLPEEQAGLVAQAYATSAAGSKPWLLTAKQQEHIAVIFGALYEVH